LPVPERREPLSEVPERLVAGFDHDRTMAVDVAETPAFLHQEKAAVFTHMGMTSRVRAAWQLMVATISDGSVEVDPKYWTAQGACIWGPPQFLATIPQHIPLVCFSQICDISSMRNSHAKREGVRQGGQDARDGSRLFSGGG